MEIISQFADKEITESTLNANADLKRLAFEFCATFNCKVAKTDAMGARTLAVLTPSGLVAGTIRVDSSGVMNKAGERIPVYYYNSKLVGKDKGSARSDSNTRDSTKISTLINTVRRMGEGPSDQKLSEKFHRGLDYAFSVVNRSRATPKIELGHEEVLAAVKYTLGLDTNSIGLHTATLTEQYRRYMQAMKNHASSMDDRQRFNEGCYAIGIVREHSFHTLFAEVMHDGNHASFQGPVKRYAKVADIPEMSAHLPIIRTWAEGAWSDHKNENEFGLPMRDTYYPEVDVATGYETHNLMWVLIPKKGA